MVEVLLQKLNTKNVPLLTYVADNLVSFNLDINTPVTPYPIPQKNADEQILVKIMGNSAQIQFSWVLHGGEDISSTLGSFALGTKIITMTGGSAAAQSDIGRQIKSGGTVIGYLLAATSTKWTVATNKTPAVGSILSVVGGVGNKTVQSTGAHLQPTSNFLTANQQIAFFYGTFQPVEIADKYRILINDVGGTPFQADGFYHQQTFNITGDEPRIWQGSVTFYIGDNIVAFESDAPSEPLNLNLATGGSGSGSIGVSWQIPTTKGGSNITNYRIYYRKNTEIVWSYVETDVVEGTPSTSYTLTGLESGEKYEIKVGGINLSGVGRSSSSKLAGAG